MTSPCPSPEQVCCGGWCTRWGASEELKGHYPPRHSDFRDSAPEPLSAVVPLYQPVVEDGRWTEGLCEMWWRKNKAVKHSVHIPCWDSFKWNPLQWRGPCFGRTLEECYWTGLRQTRWARAVYAANLGREYVMPVRNVGRHGYKSDIKALCWMYWLMSCIFSCGIGQAATCCGANMIINFGAWFSCHARERLRRRYKLPPTFCLPPGIDDCLVHFFCFYCASHQELRELALRGVDGPGMHILDVLPNSFPTAPGIEKAKSERRQLLEAMLRRPPKMFRSRPPPDGTLRAKVAAAAGDLAEYSPLEGEEPGHGELAAVPLDVQEASISDSREGSEELGAGWMRYTPPQPQRMRRSGGGGGDVELSAASMPSLPGRGDSSRSLSPTGPQWPSRWLPPAGAAAAAVGQARGGSERRVAVVREEPPMSSSAAADGGDVELKLRRWSVAY